MKKTMLLFLATWLVSVVLYSATVDFLKLKEADITQSVIDAIRENNERVVGPSFNFSTIPFNVPTTGDPLFVEHIPWTKNFAPYINNPGGGELYFYHSIPEHFVITQDPDDPLLVTFTPPILSHWYGSELVIVTVSDAPLDSGTGSFSTSILRVTITATPDSPILNFGADFPPAFPEDTTLTIDFTDYIQCVDSAPDNFNLFLAQTTPAPYNVALLQTPAFTGNLVTFDPIQDFYGSVNVVLTAVDRSSSAISDTVITITVLPVTDPPVIDSFLPVETNITAVQFDTIPFSVVTHDVDGPEMNYIWRISGIFNGIPFTNVFSNVASTSYDFDIPGVYTVECEIFDGGLSDFQTWTVTVSPTGPIFNPWGAVFYNSISVTLATPAEFPLAPIYYTLDGSEPNQTSTLFNPLNPILINAVANNDFSQTIKAIYYQTGLPPSEVITQDYLITGTVSNPVFSMNPSPQYYDPIDVALTTITNGAQIYYTLDGTDPVVGNPNTFLYAAAIHIPVETEQEIRAIAVKDNWLPSSVVSATYSVTNIVRILSYEFNPSPGDYDIPLDETLEALINDVVLFPAGATLHYTIDNSIPIETSPVYHNLDEISMSSPTTIRIRAFYPDWQPSDIVSVVYNLYGQTIITPYSNGTVFNPTPNTYTTQRNVSINSTYPAGGTVYYTLDGTDPSPTNGTLYVGPILIATSTVIRARAYHTMMRPSPIYQGLFTVTGKVARPLFNPAAGTYPVPQEITITSATPGANIYYSLDGIDPVIGAPNTTHYVNPVSISWGTTTLKARAFLDFWDDSDVRTGTYNVSILPTPVFNYASGTYQDTLAVRILVVGAPGAQIYYTTDGSAPIEGVNLYNDANPIIIPLNGTTTVRARAFFAGWNPSDISERTYVITGAVSNPQFTPPAGDYTGARMVSIISTTPGAVVRYTTNGIDPTVDYGNIYTDPILVDTGVLIKAIAYKDTWSPSEVVSANYVIFGTVSAPVFTPPAGTYTNPVSVYLNTSTIGAEILYTTDGSNPSQTDGILYSSSSPIPIGSSLTVKAIAYIPGENSSPISSADYIITGIVSTPIYNPPAGEYASAQTVSISTTTPGATIRYTTNGDEPSVTTGDVFNPATPLIISQTTTVKAIAYKTGWLPSPISSAIYQINGAVTNPIFSPIAGSYNAPQTVGISAFPSSAVIRYTTDGSVPSESVGNIYAGPIIVDRGITIKAIAYQENWLTSGVSTAVYSFNVISPLITPPSGIYAEPQTVTLANMSAGSTIRFTTDGTDPTAVNGSEYSAPFIVNTNTVVKAYALRDGWNDSPIVFANYIVNGAVTAPVLSMSTGTYYSNFSVSITTFPADATIRYTIDGSNPTETNGFIYSTPVLINNNTVLKAFAYKALWQSSPISQAIYTLQVTSPVINPGGGNFNEAQNISLNTVTPGAYIRYTTDGTIPSSTNGTLYTGSFEINSNLVLRTIAYKADWNDSEIALASYQFNVATPVYTPPAGNYSSNQSVSITSATANAQIRYTLDGTQPSETDGIVYNSEILINASTTLKAIAYKADWISSPVASGTYTFDVSAPVFSPPAGSYAEPQNVTLTSETPGIAFRYTVDGSIPDALNGILYSGPILVDSGITIKAVAFKSGWITSPVASAVYQFAVETPLFNPPAGLYSSAQSVVITTTTSGASIRYTENGTTPTPTTGTLYSTPILIPENTTKIIKAIAYKDGWESSTVAEGGYVITGTVVLNGPIFNLAEGIYQTSQSVSITGTPIPADAVVRYTTDGTDPVETSPLYTTPIDIPLASTITIKVRAFKTNWVPSDVYSRTYTVTGQVVLQLPLFSPIAGAYEFAQFVTLNTNTLPTGATLRYTTDGSIPNETSLIYSSPILMPLGSTTVLSVRGYKTDWIPSETLSATYIISSQVTFNAPVFDPPSGAYTTQQLVTINSTIPADAVVRYTTDGSDPTIASSQYTVPIVVPGNTAMIIKARAYAAGYTPSDIATAVYNANILPVPQFSPESGTYTSSQSVSISVPVENAIIYYTLDGSDPDASSNLYTVPLSTGLNTTMLIKAKAYKAGWGPSQTASATYIITGTVSDVVMNPAGGIFTSAQNVALSTATSGAAIYYTIDGTDPDETSAMYSAAINVPLNTSRTIKARAYKNGWVPSGTSTETYNVTGQVSLSTPTFSINPGTYQTAQTVAIIGTPTPNDAVLHYTTDGTDPVSTSPVYTVPIAIPLNSTVQLKVRAYKADWLPSPVYSGTFIVTGQIALADPLFTPAPGIYQSAQTVVIDTNAIPPGSTIRFTIDGTLPTENSFAYTNPIQLPLNANTTIRVRAFKNDWLPSNIISGVYQITGQVTLNQPVFSPQPGIYTTAQTVAVNNAEPSDATIRYTLDGSEPTVASPIYNIPISIPLNTAITLKVKAFKTNWMASETFTGIYNVTGQITIAQPIFTPEQGSYTDPIDVSINTLTIPAGAIIHYTTDGSNPDLTSPVYSGAIHIGNESQVLIKARAYASNWISSEIYTGLFTVTGQVAAVAFNPMGGTYQTAQNVILTTPTDGASIRYTTDGSEPNIGSALYMTAINVPLNTTMTIKAKAYKSGWTASDTASQTYSVTGQVTISTPIFNINPGLYQTAQSVSITGVTFPGDAIIRYTTDGSDPTPASPVYSAAIAVPLNTVMQIRVKAFRADWLPSVVYSGTYTVTGQVALPTPLFSPLPGIYQTAQVVTIDTNTLPSGATLRYTLDGTVPSESSPSYTMPIALPLNSTTTIRVRGYLNDWITSDVTTGVFQITGSVADVVFNPAGGIYQTPQEVTLSTVTSGATIRYTTDGTDPTELSAAYSNPITVPLNSTITVKAKAYKSNWVSSNVTSETYIVTGQIVFNQPVFNPPSGIYTTQQLVSINTTVPADAVVKYTTDGTDPTMSSATYTTPIVVPGSTSMVIKAKAFAVNYTESVTETAIYNAYILPIPQFNPPSGTYTTAQAVVISVPADGAQIYYTTDGSEPDTGSNLYTNPVMVGLDTTMTIKAKAYKTDWVPSQTAVATYMVTGQVAPVDFNPMGGIYQTAQNVILTTPTDGASIRYTTDGSEPTTGSTLYTTSVNVPLNTVMMIKAKAYKSGWTTSVTTSETYSVTGQVTISTPIFSINPGLYQTAQTVSITGVTFPGDASVYYTTDGSDPTPASQVYTTPIAVPLNTVMQIKVKAFRANWLPSEVYTGTFTVTGQVALPSPLFSPLPGVYQTAQVVTIDTNTLPSGATLRYTLDGTVPSESSAAYTAPISLPLNSTTTVSVRAFKTDWTPSNIVTGLYQITGTTADVTFNPVSGTYSTSQSVILSSATPGASIRYTTDGSNPSETVGNLYSVAINVPVAMTIKAIAYKTNWNASGITSATYNFSVVAPTFAPSAGSYPIAQIITLNSVTAGAGIRYTLDGSLPSETIGTLYTTPFTVASSATVKAIAFKPGWTPSNVVSAIYVINGAVANPTLIPGTGTYNSNQTVSISTFPADATIRYTTDGSDPSHTNGIVYLSPISVNMNTSIKAIAYKTDWLDSGISQATITLQAEIPVLSLPSGTYASTQTLTMSTPTTGAQIRYTTNGTNPSETLGTIYTIPISINNTQTVKAIAYKTGWTSSPIVTGSYEITGQVAAVTFNPLGGVYQLAQNVVLSTPTPGAVIRYTTDGSQPSEASASYTNSIPVPLNTTMTIIAKAYLTGWTPSVTTQQTYAVTGQIAFTQPVFSPPSGTYTTPQLVTINTPIPSDATVRYTTDGSDPSITNGSLYTGAINVATGMTLKVIAYKTNWLTSPIASAIYNFNVTAPVFNPLAGSYPIAQTITLTTTTAGAGIRYTTDGTNPSETSGNLYTTPFVIDHSTNVKAIAFKSGWASSGVVSAAYVINGSVANPVFNPLAGTYNSNQTVTITSFPADATIRYTTDGSTPSHTQGTVYSAPVAVNVNTTIRAIAYNTDWLDSGISQAVYNLQTENPNLSLASGTYTSTQTLTITTPTAGALIRYTTNGTNPSETVGTPYTTPITISTTQTVKAIAYKTGWNNSSIVTGDYIITGQVANVTFNPMGGTFQNVQNVTLSTTTAGASIRYTTDGTEPSEASPTFMMPINVPLNTTMTIKAKAFRAGWVPSTTTEQTYIVTGQVAIVQPVFTPPAGTYTTAQTITVNTPVPADAVVRYTTDGSDPTVTSPQYTSPIQLPLNSTLNLRVRAFKNDWTPSPTYNALYTTTGQVAMTTPVFNPAPGLYTTPQQITINTVTVPTGATVRYTLDGSDPNAASPQYTAPIAVNNAQTVVVRARSFYPNWIPSEIYTGSYTVTGQVVIPEPVFTPAAGTYSTAQVITLNTITSPLGAELRYATDGSEPTQTSSLYSSAIPLPLDSVTNLKVKAFKTDWIASPTYSALYTITGQVAFAGDLLSPPPGTYTTAQNVAISASVYPTTAVIHYTTDSSEPTEDSPVYTEAITIPLNTANFVIKVKAYSPNWTPSVTVTGVYTVTGQVILSATPLSLPAGVYTTAQTVSSTPPVLPLNATIRYTTDGNEPTLDSPAFMSPLVLPENTITTVKLKGFADSWIPSETVTAVYTITGTVATPTFSHPGDIYSEAFTLVLQSATTGAEIRYTTDGSEPSAGSALYTDGISITDMTQDLTVKAKAFKTDWIDSQTASETYSVLLLPINVRAFTYAGFIRVIWNSPIVTRALDGFNIYRKRFDEAVFVKLNTTPIISEQNGEYYYDDYSIMTNKSYQYYVTAIYNGVESNPSATTTIEYQSQDLTISDVSHAYPNPAETSCKIKLVLSKNENVQISVSVFDFAGKKVQTLTVPTTNANLIEIPWDLKSSGGVKQARGTYFARIVANDGVNRVEKVIKIAVK